MEEAIFRLTRKTPEEVEALSAAEIRNTLIYELHKISEESIESLQKMAEIDLIELARENFLVHIDPTIV